MHSGEQDECQPRSGCRGRAPAFFFIDFGEYHFEGTGGQAAQCLAGLLTCAGGEGGLHFGAVVEIKFQYAKELRFANRAAKDIDHLAAADVGHLLHQGKEVVVNVLEFSRLLRLAEENHELAHEAGHGASLCFGDVGPSIPAVWTWQNPVAAALVYSPKVGR